MTDFVILMVVCGYTSCYPPAMMDMKTEQSCVRLVEGFAKVTERGRDGFNAICIDKLSGEILASAIPLKPANQKPAR